MNLIETMNRFPNHEVCIRHLEKARWGESNHHCPHCASVKVNRKLDGERIGRWHCKDCHASYNVLAGTFMQGTKIELQKWFLAITLLMNAKKSLSSCQLARDLDLNQKTAWYMQQRIRSEMMRKEGKSFLQGIIEADETYVGGKPRKSNKRNDDDNDAPKNKRGRGTEKTPVIGAVERGGKVIARVATDLTSKGILQFLRENIRIDGSTLITDEYRAYNAVKGLVDHKVINHSEQYVDGETHTNTIEGFWSLLKRAWYGAHHHYRKVFMPLYVAEAAFKYNHRKDEAVFDNFLNGCFV